MDKIVDIELGSEAPPNRMRAWQQMLEQNVMGVDCRNAGEDLHASVKVRIVDSGCVGRARFTSQTMCRTPDLIKKAADETVLIAFVKDGTHVIRQGHQSAVLEGSGVYVLDGTRPFEVDFASDPIMQTVIHVPKAALTKRIGAIEDLAFGPTAPLQKLLATFAQGLNDSFDQIDADTVDSLLNQALDLFALMVAQGKRNAIDPSTHRAGTLLRIKAYIKAHLRDHDLTIERTAQALGISSRYVNALLATEGTSFGRYVLAARLECARQEITDPRRIHKQVAEVAFDWGFHNSSHFGRAFRERFGMTPRDTKLGGAKR